MLDDRDCRSAAALLDECRREGRHIAHLPENLRPSSRAEGYRVQAALDEVAGQPVRAWKIAATSAAGQAHIAVDGPLAGRIHADRILPPGAEVPLAGNNMRVIELEFAFRLGRDLPPRPEGYAPQEIREAVAALHPAVEIPASRFARFTAVGAPALIADNSCANLFVFGDAFDDAAWRDRDLAAWRVRAGIGEGAVTEGVGRNVLGDPWTALEWLVGEASRHGLALGEGQYLSTGTCHVPVPVGEGDRLTADFGLGEPIRLSFA